MRKKLLASILICAPLILQAQRNIDLKVEKIVPADEVTLYSGIPLSHHLKITNLGTEPLLETDSIHVYQYFDGESVPYIDSPFQPLTGQEIQPGEEWTYSFQHALLLNSSLPSDHELCYRIVPANGADPIQDSDIENNLICTQIHYLGFLSTQQTSEEKHALIPNPAQDKIQIGGDFTIDQVEIYTTSGKLLKQLEVTNQWIDVSDIANGAYLLRFFANNKLHTSLLHVQR